MILICYNITVLKLYSEKTEIYLVERKYLTIIPVMLEFLQIMQYVITMYTCILYFKYVFHIHVQEKKRCWRSLSDLNIEENVHRFE